MTVSAEAPCEKCPFRRNSKPRGVGSEEVHLFLHTAEGQIGCTLRDEAVCIGSLIYMSNTCKLPRDKEYAALVGATEQNKLIVFSSLEQMRRHHEKETE